MGRRKTLKLGKGDKAPLLVSLRSGGNHVAPCRDATLAGPSSPNQPVVYHYTARPNDAQPVQYGHDNRAASGIYTSQFHLPPNNVRIRSNSSSAQMQRPYVPNNVGAPAAGPVLRRVEMTAGVRRSGSSAGTTGQDKPHHKDPRRRSLSSIAALFTGKKGTKVTGTEWFWNGSRGQDQSSKRHSASFVPHDQENAHFPPANYTPLSSTPGVHVHVPTSPLGSPPVPGINTSRSGVPPHHIGRYKKRSSFPVNAPEPPKRESVVLRRSSSSVGSYPSAAEGTANNIQMRHREADPRRRSMCSLISHQTTTDLHGTTINGQVTDLSAQNMIYTNGHRQSASSEISSSPLSPGRSRYNSSADATHNGVRTVTSALNNENTSVHKCYMTASDSSISTSLQANDFAPLTSDVRSNSTESQAVVPNRLAVNGNINQQAERLNHSEELIQTEVPRNSKLSSSITSKVSDSTKIPEDACSHSSSCYDEPVETEVMSSGPKSIKDESNKTGQNPVVKENDGHVLWTPDADDNVKDNFHPSGSCLTISLPSALDLEWTKVPGDANALYETLRKVASTGKLNIELDRLYSFVEKDGTTVIIQRAPANEMSITSEINSPTEMPSSDGPGSPLPESWVGTKGQPFNLKILLNTESLKSPLTPKGGVVVKSGDKCVAPAKSRPKKRGLLGPSDGPPGMEHVEWTEHSYTVDEVAENFKDSFPIVARITHGYYGECSLEFVADQVLQIHSISHQKRILATDNMDRIISVPLDYPVNVQLLDRKINRGQMLLHDVIRTTSMPFLARVTGWAKTGQTRRGLDLIHMELTFRKVVEEPFLRGNAIKEGWVDQTEIVVVPSVLGTELSVGRGLRGAGEDEWLEYKGMFERSIRHLRFDDCKGLSEAVVLPDDLAAELRTNKAQPPQEKASVVYENIRPSSKPAVPPNEPVYANIQSSQGQSAASKFHTIQSVAGDKRASAGSSVAKFSTADTNITSMFQSVIETAEKEERMSKIRSDILKNRNQGKQSEGKGQHIAHVHGKLKVSSVDTPKAVVQPTVQNAKGPFVVSVNVDETLKNKQKQLKHNPRDTIDVQVKENTPQSRNHSGPPQVSQKPKSLKDPKALSIHSMDDIPTELFDLTVEDVCKCLELLNMDEHVQTFRRKQVDGGLLMGLDEQVLQREFKLTPFSCSKLLRFTRGWRPKLI